jgi:hypothetical protein
LRSSAAARSYYRYRVEPARRRMAEAELLDGQIAKCLGPAKDDYCARQLNERFFKSRLSEEGYRERST